MTVPTYLVRFKPYVSAHEMGIWITVLSNNARRLTEKSAREFVIELKRPDRVARMEDAFREWERRGLIEWHQENSN